MEVASIVVAPIILCVSLPRCAEEICKFVRESKVEVRGVGDVVGFSTFDFDSFEDEKTSNHALNSLKNCIRYRYAWMNVNWG